MFLVSFNTYEEMARGFSGIKLQFLPCFMMAKVNWIQSIPFKKFMNDLKDVEFDDKLLKYL